MTGMLGPRGNYSDGQILHGGDLNADLATLITNDAQTVIDIMANNSALITGCALTNGASGMQVNVALGYGYDSTGTRFYVGSGTVSLANGSSNPRFDLIVAVNSTASAVNPTTGNPTVYNTSALGVIQGTAAALPTIPALTASNYAQVGYVLVPPLVNSIINCTLYSQTTSPNSIGPIATIPSIMTHISTSILTSVVHGAQATSAGGQEVNRLAYTGLRGGVGALEGRWYANGSGNTPATDGFIFPNNNGPSGTDGMFLQYQIPTSGTNTSKKINISYSGGTNLDLFKIYAASTEFTNSVLIDAGGETITAGDLLVNSGKIQGSSNFISTSGYVYGSFGFVLGPNDPGYGPDIHSDGTNLYLETNGAGNLYFRPQGHATNTNAASLLSTGIFTINGHSALVGNQATTQLKVQAGNTAIVTVNNGSFVTFPITFTEAFSSPPVVVTGIISNGSFGVQYGFDCMVYGVTATGCTLFVGQTTGANQLMGASYIAFGVA